MYELVTGPLAWISFGVFFIGLIVRVVWYVRGLDWKLDRVTYGENTAFGIKGGLRSVFYWLLPYGTHSWRSNPWFTLLVFVLHIGILLTPVFLLGHNILLRERWGVSLPTMPEAMADALTAAVVIAALLLVLRRIALPEVRIITTAYDYLLLAIAVAPFATGLVAHYTTAGATGWLIAHILCGELLLIAIPVTKLSHFALFFLTRFQLGMDFGIKRGGMKNRGLAW